MGTGKFFWKFCAVAALCLVSAISAAAQMPSGNTALEGAADSVARVTGQDVPCAEFGFSTISEVQYAYGRGMNYVSLSRLDGRVGVYGPLSFRAAAISVSRTADEGLLGDLLTYSNIEEEDRPLAVAVAGLEYGKGPFSAFFGVKNVNEDYFVSGYTSFFTNSSCGIFPTISATCPIANYPLSSWCADFGYDSRGWSVRASLYSGRAYGGLEADDNPFLFRPASDGLFGICSVSRSSSERGYMLQAGTAARFCSGDGNGMFFWTYLEKRIADYEGGELGVLAQFSSGAFSGEGCRLYCGGGLICRFLSGRCTAGLFACCADFGTERETAAELSLGWALSEHLYLQPALHVVFNSSGTASVFLFRACITL